MTATSKPAGVLVEPVPDRVVIPAEDMPEEPDVSQLITRNERNPGASFASSVQPRPPNPKIKL